MIICCGWLKMEKKSELSVLLSVLKILSESAKL